MVADVRRLDADRLALQLAGDMTAAGRFTPTPEPLVPPVRPGAPTDARDAAE